MNDENQLRRQTAADHMRHARMLEETGRTNEAANFYQSAILNIAAERDYLSGLIVQLTARRNECVEKQP